MKGAEIVRMLKTLIGADAFARHGYLFQRFDGTAATVEDFLSCFAESSAAISLIRAVVRAGGTPHNVATEYDAGAKNADAIADAADAPNPARTKNSRC